MNISSQSLSKCTVCSISCAMDSVHCMEIEPQITDLIEKSQEPFILDLNATSYICSEGLRLLLTLAKQCTKKERTFCLACGNGQVLTVIQMSMFDKIISVYPSVEDAVAACTNE